MKDKIPVVHSYRWNDMKTGQKLFEYGRLGAKSKVNCMDHPHFELRFRWKEKSRNSDFDKLP